MPDVKRKSAFNYESVPEHRQVGFLQEKPSRQGGRVNAVTYKKTLVADAEETPDLEMIASEEPRHAMYDPNLPFIQGYEKSLAIDAQREKLSQDAKDMAEKSRRDPEQRARAKARAAQLRKP